MLFGPIMFMRPVSRFRVLTFAGATYSLAGVVSAQETGVLRTERPIDSAVVKGLRAEAVSAPDQANQAVLLFDPGFASTARSSANGLTVVFMDSLKEGRIQLNVCDLPKSGCNEENSFLFMLAGPLDDKKAGDLADLDGFIGDARVEITWTRKIVASGTPSITLSGTAAKPTFSFRSSSTLEEQKQRDTKYRLEVGTPMRGATWSLYAGVFREITFEEQSEQTVCTPASFGPTGTTVCSDIVVGAPNEIEKNGVRLEAKKAIAGVFAVGLSWRHDLTNDKDVLDIPLYFLTETTEGLAGGARVGFRSGTKERSVTFFVSGFKL